MSPEQIKSWLKPGDNLPFQQYRITGRLLRDTNIGKYKLWAGAFVKLIDHPTEDTFGVTSDLHGTTKEDTISDFLFTDFFVSK
jgi:hypothetical protein